MFCARPGRGVGLAICILSLGTASSAQSADDGASSPRLPLADALKSFRIECKDFGNRYVKRDPSGGVHISAPGLHVDVTGSAAQHNLHVQAPFVNINRAPLASNQAVTPVNKNQTGQMPGKRTIVKTATAPLGSIGSGGTVASADKAKLAAGRKIAAPELSNKAKSVQMAKAVSSPPWKPAAVLGPGSKRPVSASVLSAASSTSAKPSTTPSSPPRTKSLALSSAEYSPNAKPVAPVSTALSGSFDKTAANFDPQVNAPSAVSTQGRYAPIAGGAAQKYQALEPVQSSAPATSAANPAPEISRTENTTPISTAAASPTAVEAAAGAPVRLLPAHLPPPLPIRIMPALADNSQGGYSAQANDGGVHVPFVDVTPARNGHKHVHVHLPFLHVDHDGNQGGVQVRGPLVNVDKTPGQPAYVRAPFTQVNPAGAPGTSVRAPLTSVDKNPGQPAQVRAPFTNVHNGTNPAGVSVHAPLVKVDKNPGQPAAVQAPFTKVNNPPIHP